jgi:EpsI family protein
MSGADAMGGTAGEAERGGSRRELLLGGVLLAAAGTALARMPRTARVALPRGGVKDAIPDRVGPWRQSDDGNFVLPPSDEQAAALIYEEQLTRTYDNGVDPALMLLIAYDRQQSGLLQIHRPESCYPGSGFSLSPTRAVDTQLAPGLTARANFLTATRDDRIEQLLYWTRLGDAFPRDWHAQRHAVALQNLRGYVPDGALVRMSMITPDAERGLRQLTRFAAALFAAAPLTGRRLLGGPAIT